MTHTRTTKVVLEVLPLIIIVVVPFSVHGGMLTSLFSMMTPDESETEVVSEATSDVRLLKADTTIDPMAARGGGDLIVEEGALVSGGLFGDDIIDSEAYESGEISVYVVREGDTLSQIAEMFEVTSNTILWANNLSSATAIQPGDSLVILPIIGVRHVVKDGDSLSSIAKKYEGDSDEILSYNQLASADDLVVGNTLVIPGGNMHRPTQNRAGKVAAPTKVSGAAFATNLMHPLPGSVRTQGIHGYNAVDFGAPVGTPIRAAAAGQVILSKSGGWNGGYGTYLVIEHNNGTQTLYSHNSRNVVGVGAYVNAGETVAYVGSTGRSTGPHLHFEVRGARNPF